jgi:DNA-cytosine methyltransferase
MEGDRGVNVLSLFDGMSCGQIALNRIGIKPTKYYASELDKYAIKVTQANYPDTVQLGDVTQWREWDIDWASIDLLIGGSPCQGFSFAGKQLAFDDPRSKLFFVYVDILNHIKSVNPSVKFMLENVKMKKEFLAVISEQLGVEPVFINSALLSAQNRQRYYWCNWNVEQPEDRGIVLADILETDGTGFIKSHGEYKERSEKSQCIDANYHKGADNHGQRTLIANPAAIVGRKLDENGKRNDSLPIKQTQCLEVHDHGKSRCLSTVQKDTVVSSLPPGRYPVIREKSKCVRSSGRGSYDRHEWDSISNCHYRKLTPIECERLQTVPDNHTNHVSNTQRYKMLGNGWTVDVIAHIFSQMQVPISLLSRQLDLFGEAA